MTWTIHHADVLATLLSMPSASIDFVLTDPPYGLGTKQPTVDELVAYLTGADLDMGGDFMGKDWNVPSVRVWSELLRVLRPGAFVFCFAGPRTSDLITVGLRAAGFEVRDTIASAWAFGTGFPKSLDVSKAVDAMYLARWFDDGHQTEKAWYLAAAKWLSRRVKKGQPKPLRDHAEAMQDAIERAAGVKREVVGADPQAARRNKTTSKFDRAYGEIDDAPSCPVTAPGTALAALWDGYGTALKPSFEPILIARKPVDGTVAENVEAHGVGGLAIDASRIGVVGERRKIIPGEMSGFGDVGVSAGSSEGGTTAEGRWPANVLLIHLPGCTPVGTEKIKAAPAWNDNRPPSSFTGATTSEVHHAADDGTETVERWACVEGCAVAELDAQSGTWRSNPSGSRSTIGYKADASCPPTRIVSHLDTGGASRFFYCAKASREERDLGCDHLPLRSAAEVTDSEEDSARLDSPRTGAGRTTGARNHHPCVKPIDVCRHCARLGLPPQGRTHGPRRCLVLYAGSGSEMVGAILAGWDEVVGIERDAEFIEILKARVGLAATNPRAFDAETPKATKADPRQTDLFGRTGT